MSRQKREPASGSRVAAVFAGGVRAPTTGARGGLGLASAVADVVVVALEDGIAIGANDAIAPGVGVEEGRGLSTVEVERSATRARAP
ncbi:MAG: hypothetical protein JWM74_1677, partial [Myxococcaceae bacterium]|nr:hypothetical protein [Myxococcaceae bacterium]